jgi:hypothetical protein
MDVSQLKSLGEVAGIGGVALGVIVLLIRPLIGTIAGLPKDARAGPVKLIAIGCFVIGALGIAAWTWGSQSKGIQASTRGTQSPGVISGGSVAVNYGSPSAPQAGPLPVDTPASPLPSSAAAHTEGGQSPGVVAGGKVDIEYPSTSAATPSTSETK